jgi:hypothetical protein
MKTPQRNAVAGLLVAVAVGVVTSCTPGTGRGEQTTRPVDAWGGLKVDKVCVEVAATFEGEQVNRQAANTVDNGLDDWGLAKTRPGRACDAMVRMEYAGTAVSAMYTTHPEPLYTGYDISGQVTLAAPNQPTLTYPFTVIGSSSGSVDCSNEPCPVTPKGAKDLPDGGYDSDLYVNSVKPAFEQFFGPNGL